MSAPAKSWPRVYLLSIYEKAVAEGACWITNLSKEDWASLKGSFYRLRRRSDKSNAAIIRPEFFLVSIGAYDPVNRRAAAIYNTLPDGSDLPSLTSMSEEERSHAFEPPTINRPAPLLTADQLLSLPNEPGLAPELTAADIDGFVAKLTKKALGGGDG